MKYDVLCNKAVHNIADVNEKIMLLIKDDIFCSYYYEMHACVFSSKNMLFLSKSLEIALFYSIKQYIMKLPQAYTSKKD